MLKSFRAWYEAIAKKNRWYWWALPTILFNGFAEVYPYLRTLPADPRDFPDWHPTIWQRVTATLLGLIAAHIIAWHEEFAKNRLFTTSSPKLVLSDNPVDIARFTSFAVIGGHRAPVQNYMAFRVRFRNRPDANVDSANATAVNARITFYRPEDEALLFSMDGRWADSPQPTQRNVAMDYVASLAVPFPIGAERSVDILARRLADGAVFAVNNDNLNPEDMPARFLAGPTVLIRIELNGPRVKYLASVEFDCESFRPVGRVSLLDQMP